MLSIYNRYFYSRVKSLQRAYVVFYMSCQLKTKLTLRYLILFRKAKGLNFGPRLHLQLYFVYVSSDGSGESGPSQLAA